MAVDLKVPEMGESVTEVVIGAWRKNEGERIEQDDALVELESEKATLDLHAPSAGVLVKILKKQGESAEVGEVIGHMESAPAAAPAENKDESEKAESPQSSKEEPKKAEAQAAPQAPKEGAKPVEEKVEVKSETGAKTAQRPAAEKSTAAKHVSEATASESSRGEERVAMSPIRRRIAARLVEAQQQAALLTTFNEIDMSAVKRMRAQFGEAFEKRHAVRLGFMPFFVNAVIGALRQCAELNARIDGDEIVYRRYYDIGVAVSSDKGLVVPILRNAAEMSFAKIEQAIEDLSKRARSGELKVEELQGGTFTITNGGVFGSLLSTPIVNPPQSGVLGMHAIQDRPVAVDGQVVVRPMMYVALTYDHRIVDGREAVTFLKRVKEAIEEPARMLMEV